MLAQKYINNIENTKDLHTWNVFSLVGLCDDGSRSGAITTSFIKRLHQSSDIVAINDMSGEAKSNEANVKQQADRLH